MRFTFLMSLVLMGCPTSNNKDVHSGARVVNSGYNVYAPSVVYHDGLYRMYYGGQQLESVINDKIYLKTSTDNVNWGEPTQLFGPTDVTPEGIHVNDPSVVVNSDGDHTQFTMFYTYTDSANDQSVTQVYSAVSSDGENWVLHQPLLSNGPGEPTVVSDGSHWKVYFVDRNSPTRVQMVRVDGLRNPVGEPVVVFSNTTHVISSPEVRELSPGTWTLFFNKFIPRPDNAGALLGVDIYKVVSNSNESFDPSSEGLVYAASELDSHCAAITPAALSNPPSSSGYYLYFGFSARFPDGSCPLLPTSEIKVWETEIE